MAARLQIPVSIRRILFLPDRPSTSPIYFSFSFPIPRSSRRPLHSIAPAVYGVNNTRKVSSMAKRRSFIGQEETASSDDLQFETPLKIAEYPNPILRRKNKRIQTFDENLKRLVDEMLDIMYKTDGIGLSAPQVGINVRLMVFNPAGVRGEGEEVVLVNPKIFKVSKKIILFDEGCLSFPKIYGDVERPSSVKVEAQDINGEKFTINLSGLPARVFQHEFDHLQGILFFERMDVFVLESVRLELQALEKKYEDQTGLPCPEKIDNFKIRNRAMGFSNR
ncbi:Peptide deformylase [Zostera marina]|uniref:Peptide deformylase n=1 Tax=Zostera marina TaxID=29655 RepID=A0A0K9NU10_ZOSMR|nr:Peptide deformylase [Zostera marina]